MKIQLFLFNKHRQTRSQKIHQKHRSLYMSIILILKSQKKATVHCVRQNQQNRQKGRI
jgi:hypothetical protein